MKTNNLTYKTKKVFNNEQIFVEIKLNDECKNGNEDFAITAMIYQAGKPKIDKYCLGGGCCHDDILKAFPEFKTFVDLHLCDYTGAPMYAVENGFYHMHNFENPNHKNISMEYLRITEQEYDIIKDLDKLNFTNKLFTLGIVSRWKAEADQAIKQLEELTGLEFESKATKKQIEALSIEDQNLILEREKSGYYTLEAIEQRKQDDIVINNQRIINELAEQRDKEINKANNEFNVKMFVLNSGLPLDNFIYYSHSNEGSFNWKSYGPKITVEQLETLQSLDLPDYLPQGIKFNISKN